MPETVKVLGQNNPPASVFTDVYTVPALTSAVVSTLYVCNLSGVVAHFFILVAVGGATLDPKQFIYYNTSIPPDETFASTTGISMGSGDVLRIFTDVNGLAISLFGLEKT